MFLIVFRLLVGVTLGIYNILSLLVDFIQNLVEFFFVDFPVLISFESESIFIDFLVGWIVRAGMVIFFQQQGHIGDLNKTFVVSVIVLKEFGVIEIVSSF